MGGRVKGGGQDARAAVERALPGAEEVTAALEF